MGKLNLKEGYALKDIVVKLTNGKVNSVNSLDELIEFMESEECNAANLMVVQVKEDKDPYNEKNLSYEQFLYVHKPSEEDLFYATNRGSSGLCSSTQPKASTNY